jgi:peroxiredoxin
MGVMIIVLVRQNWQLKEQLANWRHNFQRISEGKMTLRPGDSAFPFAALLPNGQELFINTDSLAAPLILGWFSVNCEPCGEAFAPWNTLAGTFPDQFYGVCESERAEIEETYYNHEVNFPTLTPVSDTVYSQYNILLTPQTMVISTQGNIAGIWPGPLTGASLQDVITLVQNCP